MDVALVGQRIDRVRNLTGFKRSHRVPDDVNDVSAGFVARIATQQIDADLSAVYDQLRSQFRWKRKDFTVAGPADGRGSVSTPAFDYSVIVQLNPDNPTQVIWQRQVAEIREVELVLAEPFAAVFSGTFDTVQVVPEEPVDVAALIDRVEELEPAGITLSYDKDATWCRVLMAGMDGELEITAGNVSLVQRNPRSPAVLLQTFFDFQGALKLTNKPMVTKKGPSGGAET